MIPWAVIFFHSPRFLSFPLPTPIYMTWKCKTVQSPYDRLGTICKFNDTGCKNFYFKSLTSTLFGFRSLFCHFLTILFHFWPQNTWLRLVVCTTWFYLILPLDCVGTKSMAPKFVQNFLLMFLTLSL